MLETPGMPEMPETPGTGALEKRPEAHKVRWGLGRSGKLKHEICSAD